MLTTILTGDARTKKLWLEKLNREVEKESFWPQLKEVGVIYDLTDFKNGNKGDTITYQLRMRLTGAGKNEYETLRGSEEVPQHYTDSMTFHERVHAIAMSGPIDEQRVTYNVKGEDAESLKVWYREDKESRMFTALRLTPTKIFYPTATVPTSTATLATALAALTAGLKITPTLVSWVKTWMKKGGNRSQPPIEPVMIKGKKYYIWFISDDVWFDMLYDPTFNQALRDAWWRGSDNPLFYAADLIWDKNIFFTSEFVTESTYGTIPYALCHVLGKNAIAHAPLTDVKMVNQYDDYDRVKGVSVQGIYGWKKCVYNSLDHAAVMVAVARSNIQSS